MKAAVVHGLGQTPRFADFADPAPTADHAVVSVSAAALSQVTRSRASGRHYSSSGQFPFVAGIDGTGRLEDGQRVYFALPEAPHGAMAERTVVPLARCIPLPDDIDDVTAAAIANPGLSSWAAYTERARLRPGETVLVNGATGTSGRLAVQIAKYRGARKVIATGRNVVALRELEALGADVTLALGTDETALAAALEAQFAEGVDVVIDYLWGTSAVLILAAAARAGAEAVPIRFVQVGSIGGSDITLPSALLRSSAIELLGSGIGSIPLDRLIAATGEMLRAAGPAGLRIATAAVPLRDVERAWDQDDASRRTVFVV